MLRNRKGQTTEGGIITIVLTVFACLVIAGGCWAWPKYRVYQKEHAGIASLREAESDRNIKVLEAKAEMEAADHLRVRDSLRAVGVAAANRIIAHSVTPEYLAWLWVESLKEGGNDVIYVPTEGNVPILEATRLFSAFGKGRQPDK